MTTEKQTPEAWRPIKTAPRDGSNILLRFGSDGVSQGKYVPGTPYPWKFIAMEVRQAQATVGLPFIAANYGAHFDAAINAAIALANGRGEA